MIEVEARGQAFRVHQALADFDLAVEEGEVLALLGPNGAGKTTLVRILATLLRADSGRATRRRLRRGRRCGEVALADRPHRSVRGGRRAAHGRENLELVGLFYQLSRAERRRRAQTCSSVSRSPTPPTKLVKTYSGGMRRRLDVGASLIGRPRVLFLDEPTTGLDPRTRNGVWSFVEELVADGTTVLLTTQYMEEAEHLAQRIVVMDAGRVVARGNRR